MHDHQYTLSLCKKSAILYAELKIISGKNHPLVASTLTNLASVVYTMGDMKTAMKLNEVELTDKILNDPIDFLSLVLHEVYHFM